MPRWPIQPDPDDTPLPEDGGWDLGEGLDPDGPSAADLDRFGDELTHCPSCRRAIYDQMAICPHCGHALEEESSSISLWVVGWVIVLIVLLLVVVL